MAKESPNEDLGALGRRYANAAIETEDEESMERATKQNSIPNQENEFNCKFCDSTFNRTFNLNLHLRTVHLHGWLYLKIENPSSC